MPAIKLRASGLEVFMGSDGTMLHSSCWLPLQYQGARGAVEVDFYCPGCVAHVTLPLRALPAIAAGDCPALFNRRARPALADFRS